MPTLNMGSLILQARVLDCITQASVWPAVVLFLLPCTPLYDGPCPLKLCMEINPPLFDFLSDI